MNRPSNNKRQAMKTELSIQTPSAGIVRVVPDYLELKGCVGLQYLSEVTTAQRTAAAHYRFDEGFIELAEGKIELELLWSIVVRLANRTSLRAHLGLKYLRSRTLIYIVIGHSMSNSVALKTLVDNWLTDVKRRGADLYAENQANGVLYLSFQRKDQL